MIDVEAEAGWLLRDFDARRPPGARKLAEHHLGRGCVEVWRGIRRGDAVHAVVDGWPRIFIRPHLDSKVKRWAILHELAECHLARLDYREGDVELVAEALTAALVAPRDAYLEAWRDHGQRFDQLAFDFATTETCAALRLGEVTGTPIAVITPAVVRVRGDDWAWPDAEAIRKAAARRAPRGMRRVRLRDDRRRIALVA